MLLHPRLRRFISKKSFYTSWILFLFFPFVKMAAVATLGHSWSTTTTKSFFHPNNHKHTSWKDTRQQMGKTTFFHLCQQRPTDFVFSVFHLHFLMMMMRICELVAVNSCDGWDAAALPGKVLNNSCSFCRNSLEKRQPSYVGDFSFLRARRAGIICIDYLYCGPAPNSALFIPVKVRHLRLPNGV